MFELNKHKAIISDLPLISNNYLELISDENPILYTGNNRYGNRILGIIIEESDDYSLHYFHVIIDDRTYYDFVNKQKTLLGILRDANIIFIVSWKGGEVDNTLVTFDEIPAEYLPLEDSFCPHTYFIPSLNFGVSLKGKKADKHLVEIPDANHIQTTFAEVLRNAIRGLDELELNPKVYLEPAVAGSFKVNYRIEFESIQASLFHVDDRLISKYLTLFLNYIIDKLPKEERTLKQLELDSEAFVALESSLEEIYESSHIGLPSGEKLENKIVDNLNQSALKFEDVVNQIKNSSSFDRIELVNYPEQGGEVGLGIIDEKFYEKIREKLVFPETDVTREIIEEDQVEKTYRILVYHLNTNSGNCWAFFYPNDETEENYKIPIRIRKDDQEYHHTILSKSLDEKKVVNVKGYAERVNGRVTSITVPL